MSYNGGYNYSPYFQPTAGQHEQGQHAYQNTTNSGGQFPSQLYSSGAHTTPQQSSIPGPQSFYSQPVPPADRPSASYARLNDVPNASQYKDSRGGYGYAPRSSVDTTALGNLAHASTLGQESRTPTGAARDNASLQQIIDYNRARNSQGSAGSIAYDSSNTGYVYSHERTGSRDTANPNSSHPNDRRTQTPTHYQQTQFTTTAGYSNSTPAPVATQGASQSAVRTQYQQNSDQQRQKTQQQQYSQPTRPTSGGSHRSSIGAHGQNTSHQASQSPTVPTYRTPAANAGTYANASTTSRSEQSRYVQGSQPNQQTSASPAPVQSNRNYYATPIGPQSSNTQDSSSSVRSQQTSEALTTVSPEEQGPKTVDPSHVFNHYEYQRRQAAKKAAEAEEIKKAAEAATALKRVSDHSATLSPETQSREEQMAAEMRQMIEKMRDYKSKDPSLFSQIWEQVKKTQPAGSIPAVPLSVTGPATAHNQTNGVRSDTGKNLSPSPQSAGMPDLGKFPAQRRRRGGSNVNPTRKRKSGGLSETNGAASNGQRPSSPISGTQAYVNGIDGQAEQDRPQDRQVVYVSGTGPGPSSHPNQGISGPSPAAQPAKPVPAQGAEEQQPSSKGRTNWPEHKKWDLAVAAKATLLSYPMNVNRTHNITPEQILGFLNENPSYEELCRMIESRGFILERSHFARSLLQAIPDKDPTARAPPPPPQQQENDTIAGQSSPKSARQQKKGAGFGMLGLNPSIDNQPYRPPTAQMTPSQSLGEGTSQIEEKSAVPLTKQEMARKRNIAEIVDLSQLSDDDMPPPPSSKTPRLDGSPQLPPAGQRDLDQSFRQPHTTHRPPNAFNVPGMPPYMYRPPQYHSPAQFPPVPSASNRPFPLSRPHGPPSSIQSPAPSSTGLSSQQRDLVNREDIVRPLDKQNDKKRKKYDPKTIVRDVLIASARHPTMMPLNYHLEGLRKVFKHVNDFSDLSTFRWDLVDPGEPIIPARRAPIPAPAPTPVPVVHSLEEENDADDEEPSHSSHALPQATQTALDIDSNGTAHIVSSTRPSHHTRHPPKLLGPQRKRVPGDSRMNSGTDSFVAVNDPDMTPLSTSGEVTIQPGIASTASITNTPLAPAIKRRGRPPKSNSREVAAQPSTVSPASITDTSPTSTIRRRGRPPGAKNKHPRKSSGTIDMPTRTRTDTTPARPSGLRHTVSSTDGIAIVVPSPSPSVTASGLGRRSKNTGSPKSSQQKSPIFRVYKCQWKGCPAELHNLETLKKHVLKHSGHYDDGPLPCLWKGCGRKVEGNEEASEEEDMHQPLEFGTKEIWAKHMERRHIIDDAWRLGDGPNNRSDSDMSDYVSDSAKRQVTPIISGKGPPDPLPLGSGSKSAKVYHKAHGNTTEQGKAEAFMAASEERRRGFGPGIDRTGATFVTKRKQALLNDEVGLLTKARKRTGD